ELQRLPEKYRAPLVLCYLEGKTNEEVAQQLRWPVGSVKGRLNRARSLLQGRLARRGLAPSAGVMLPALGQNTVPSVLVRATVEGAVQFAFAGGAGIGSTPATALAEGTLKAMFMKKVKTAALGLAALAILASGI